MPNGPSRRPTEPREPGLLPRGVTICRGCGGLGFDCSMGACRVCGGTGRVRGNATNCAHCGGRLFVDPDRLPDDTYERSCVRCGARSYLDAQGKVIEPVKTKDGLELIRDGKWYTTREPNVELADDGTFIGVRFDPDAGRYVRDEELTTVLNSAPVGEDEGYDDDDDDDDPGPDAEGDEGEGSQSA